MTDEPVFDEVADAALKALREWDPQLAIGRIRDALWEREAMQVVFD